MIHARVVVVDGCLTSFDVSGHASIEGGPAGFNLICAGVTSLVRSVAQCVIDRESIPVAGSPARPGTADLRLGPVSGRDREWLRGVTGVLVAGLSRIAADAPGDVSLAIEQRGEEDGT